MLYGTTVNGGTNFAGTVFQLTANGLFGSLYSFTGGDDGANPFATLAQGPAGNFFGTTFQGGAGDNGTAFSLGSSGGLNNLLSFASTNGDLPYAGLTWDNSGNLFGMTSSDGPIGGGTVFELTPANGGWSYSVAYGLPGVTMSDFANPGPRGTLIVDPAGNFYGTTIENGSENLGTVFMLTPGSSGFTYTDLYDFCTQYGCPDGSWPWAGVVRDSSGNLYGSGIAGGYEQGNCRVGGCGVAFEITP